MNTNIFDALATDEAATLTRLHHRLAHDADAADLLDVAYRTIDSPVGTLLLAATTTGLVRVAYDVEGHDAVLAGLADRISPRVLRAPARLDNAARQIDEYFAKRRTVFEVPVDLRLAEGFRRSVIEHLRAVGTACAHNPLPVVIPCHRVVRSDGSTGQYVGGPLAKSTLLDLETA